MQNLSSLRVLRSDALKFKSDDELDIYIRNNLNLMDKIQKGKIMNLYSRVLNNFEILKLERMHENLPIFLESRNVKDDLVL